MTKRIVMATEEKIYTLVELKKKLTEKERLINIFITFVLWLGLSGSVIGCIAPPTILINSNTIKSNKMKNKKSKLTYNQKKEIYSPKFIELANEYKDTFKLSCESYCDGNKLQFEKYNNKMYLLLGKINKQIGIKYKYITEYAYLLDENIALINGDITSKSYDHLYFIESSKHIKIGRTNNIKTRLSSLKNGNPDQLNVLFVKYNAGDNEFALHRLFDYLRVKGEWFLKNSDIYNYIKLLGNYPNFDKNEYEPFPTKNTNKLIMNHNI